MSWRDRAIPVTAKAAEKSTGTWRDRARPADTPMQANGFQEKQHDDISWLDRAKVKNFSNSDESSVKYLKDRYPDMDIKAQGGRILIRRPNEPVYKVLDPDADGFGDGIQEFAQDTLDVGYDVASGLAESVITGLAGAAGFASPVPGGALAAGSAASSAASAGSDVLKQGLGKLLGMNEEYDGWDTVIAGGAGALGPLAFGLDKAGGKQYAKALARHMRQNGTGRETAEQVFDAATRGGLKKAYDGTKDYMPKVGEFISGIPERVIRSYSRNMDGIENSADDVLLDMAENAQETIKTGLSNIKRTKGQKLQAAIEGAGEKVNISSAKAALKARIEEIKSYGELQNNELLQQELNAAETAYRKLFSGDASYNIRDASPSEAQYLNTIINNREKELARAADIDAGKWTDFEAEKLASRAEFDATEAARKAEWEQGARSTMDSDKFVHDIEQFDAEALNNKWLDDLNAWEKGEALGKRQHLAQNASLATYTPAPKPEKPTFYDLKVNKLVDPIEDFKPGKYVEPEKPTLNTPISPIKDPDPLPDNLKVFLNPDGSYKTRELVEELPDELSARDAFKLQQWIKDQADLKSLDTATTGTRHSGNATVGEMQLADEAGNAYRKLNQEFERVTGGMSKELKDEYGKYAKLQKNLNPAFKSEEATLRTLGSLDTKSRQVLLDRLRRMANDPETGDMAKKILSEAEKIEALLYFKQPALAPMSLKGTTSTSRTIPLATASGSLGALLGYKLGGGYTGATVGGGFGALMGNTLGSPWWISKMVKAGHFSDDMGKAFMKDPKLLEKYLADNPKIMGSIYNAGIRGMQGAAMGSAGFQKATQGLGPLRVPLATDAMQSVWSDD